MNANILFNSHPLFWHGEFSNLPEPSPRDRGWVIYKEGGNTLSDLLKRKIPKAYETADGKVMTMRERMVEDFKKPLESDFFAIIGYDYATESVSMYPFHVPIYATEKEGSDYIPKYLIRFRRDGVCGRGFRPVVADVKSAVEITSDPALHAMRTRACKAESERRGLTYRVFTEEDLYTPYLLNVRFFEGFRSFICSNECYSAWLKYLYSVGEISLHDMLSFGVAEFARTGEKSKDTEHRILPDLFSLIAHGWVRTRLDVLVTMESRVCSRSRAGKSYSIFRQPIL